MLLDQINLNYLRIFESVYRTRSMTQAAQELHLTQSGISQHVKSLEDSLEVKLFDRIKQKLIPTDAGHALYSNVSPQIKSLEQALLVVTAKDQSLRGNVTLGVPVVFGLNIIIPLLTELGKDHPDLKFTIRFELAHTINNLLLNGEVDFAFVDDFVMDINVKTEKVYDEVLQLCCSQEYFKKVKKIAGVTQGRKFFEAVDYIAYERGEPIIRKWLHFHHRGGQFKINVKATVADALGISRFVKSGLGFGVLPGHHVEKLNEQGDEIFVVDTNGKELKNKISVAYVETRSRSAAVRETLDFLLAKLRGN